MPDSTDMSFLYNISNAQLGPTVAPSVQPAYVGQNPISTTLFRLVSDLAATHPSFNNKTYTKYKDFFEGGECFRKNIKHYLKMRAFEAGQADAAGMGGSSLSQFFKQRVAAASYINIVGPLIGWLIGCVLSSEPRINARTLYLAEDMPDKDDSQEILDAKKARRDLVDQKNLKRIQYYQGLNKNADGRGNTLTDVCRLRLTDGMVYGRCYFSAVYPEDVPAGESLDAHIDGLSPWDVIDWDFDKKSGKLNWVKTHCVEYGRPDNDPLGPVCFECNYWTFISADRVICYEARRSLQEAAENTWPEGDKQTANLVEDKPHQTGQPVVDLCVNPDFHVMSRLWDTAWSLFNREAALSFSLDCQAIALPTIKSNRENSEIGTNFVMSELALVHIKQDETLEFVTPSGTHFDASAKHVDTLKNDMYAQIMAMSAQSSQVPSAGRLSAASKKVDVEMLSAFLSVFASMGKTGLYKVVRNIQHVKGDDDLCITIDGLDRFTIQDVELLLKKIKEMCELPGSATAKRRALAKLNKAVNSDADIDTLNVIDSECNALTDEQLNQAKVSVKESVRADQVPDETSGIIGENGDIGVDGISG